MAKAVEVFKDAAIEKERLEANDIEQRRRASEQQDLFHAQQAAAAAQQANVVTSLASGLARLAKGDLTHQLVEPFAPDYEALRVDFNAAVAQLQTIVAQIIANSQGIRTGTEEDHPRRGRPVPPHRAAGGEPRGNRRSAGRDHRDGGPDRRERRPCAGRGWRPPNRTRSGPAKSCATPWGR